MANLIPPAAKQDILTEYWVRIASVWFILLGAAALTLAVLHVPVYVLIQNQLQTYSSLYDNAAEESTSFEKAEAEIVRANDTVTLLATARNVRPLVPYVSEIEALAGSAIEINSLTMSRTGTVLESIQVSGVAASREALVSFSQAVEAADNFTSAEIPLSNLAKDSNIPFTINVLLVKDSASYFRL